ncbi:MAG: MFS transporter [Pseudomonadota bacterium]
MQKPGTQPGFCAPEARIFILIAAILGSALGFIDGTVIAIALPAIRAGLGASLVEAQWINNGYLLPLGALILLGGAFGDKFGTARIFAAGIAVFVVASLVCAAAPTTQIMIGARVVQGIGAAMMVPGSLAMIARAYPEAERGRAIGIWAAASALTTALGPILGGLALSLGGPEMWRLIFAINLPLGGLALYLILTRVGDDPTRSAAPLDVVGAALITAGLGLVAFGLTAAAEGHGDVRPLPVAAGFAAIAIFVFWEARARAPMVPLSLFQDRGFAMANLATLLIYFAFSTIVFFLPMTLIAGWGLDEFLASAAFAPLSVFIPLLSAQAGKLADRIGPGPLIGAGAALMTLAYLGLVAIMPSQEFWTRLLPVTAVMGAGMGLVVAPLSTAIMGGAPSALAGTASGINNAVGRVAGLVSVALMGTIVGAAYLRLGGTDSFGVFSDAPGHGAAMIAAFQTLCWLCAALSALAALLSWLVIPRPQA